MKLFVTGGSGFIGSNFIRYWLRHHPGDEILNYDLLTYAGNADNLRDEESNPNYRFVKGDILDKSLVAEMMAGSDVVVHFAAETHVDRSLIDCEPFFRTNVLGTAVLIESALESKIKKFIHISTDEVFGELKRDEARTFNELSAYSPQNPYAASKAAADFLIQSYIKSHRLPAIITHSGNNYGPYQFPEKFIPLGIINALSGKNIPVYGEGRQIRNWIYVEDNVRAIEAVIEKGEIGERYCIGGEEMENISVAKKILSILGREERLISFVKDRPGHDERYAVDSSKIKRELGWRPLVQFEEGIKKTVEWYSSNKNFVKI